MKIPKSDNTQKITWFSNKRYCREMLIRSKSYFEIGDKDYYKSFHNPENKFIFPERYRKNGPAAIYKYHSEQWFSNKNGTHRIDGPAYKDLQTKNKDRIYSWFFKHEELSEQEYWNK